MHTHHRLHWAIGHLLITALVLAMSIPASAQTAFQISWQEEATMPSPHANNAVVGAMVDGTYHVYSFTGIGPGLGHEDISLEAWRYTPSDGSWLQLPDVPDTLGKIAAGASYLNGKIYLVGGYHVLPSGNELSSDRIHIFDVASNTWEEDGSPIPVPIDDHIQAVWRDSLIYVITGWSNSGNVSDVQIYDPSTDSWAAGTPVPSLGAPAYRVFGGSGAILGDRIFYAGGARISGFSFVLGDGFRTGEIDPADPGLISWHTFSDEDALNYRAACTVLEQQGGLAPVWIGGSNTAYNFDAIAYNGSGLVQPNKVVTVYSVPGDSLYDKSEMAPPVMDLRGITVFDDQAWTMGGIEDAQQVPGTVYRYQIEGLPNGLTEGTDQDLIVMGALFPSLTISLAEWNGADWSLLRGSGQVLNSGRISSELTRLSRKALSPGLYIILVQDGEKSIARKFVVAG